jgi:DNA-binding protein H-NS
MKFSDVIAIEGYMPSLCMAKDMLGVTISNILYGADDVTVAKAAISTALKDFSAYVEAVTAMLPERAFKADVSLTKSYTPIVEKMDDMDEDDMSDENKAKKAKAKKEDEPVADAPVVDEPTVENTDPAVTPEVVAVVEPVAAAPAVVEKETPNEALQGLTALIESLKQEFSSQLGELKESVETSKAATAEMSARLAKAEEAVNGTVLSGTAGDREPQRKSAKVHDLGPIDTAYGAAA